MVYINMEYPIEIYKKFWVRFIMIMNNVTCKPDVLDFQKSVQKKKNKSIYDISLGKPICLIAWPLGGSKVNRVHIIINFSEQYEHTGTEIEIIKSNASVYYCKNERSKNNEVAVESLRYDFHPDTGAAEGDPLVHVQIESEYPDASKFQESFKQKLVEKPKRDIKFTPLKLEYIKYIRIPTIQMSLPGVLCSLVADHIRDGSVHNIIDKTEDTFSCLSKLYKIAPKRWNCKLWNHASARHWYNYESRKP